MCYHGLRKDVLCFSKYGVIYGDNKVCVGHTIESLLSNVVLRLA